MERRLSSAARTTASGVKPNSRKMVGASADFARIYQEYGITAEAVAAAARDSITAVRG